MQEYKTWKVQGSGVRFTAIVDGGKLRAVLIKDREGWAVKLSAAEFLRMAEVLQRENAGNTLFFLRFESEQGNLNLSLEKEKVK